MTATIKLYQVFIGDFLDGSDKRIGRSRGTFTTFDKALDCLKKFLPRDTTMKGEIHEFEADVICDKGLGSSTICALIWWHDSYRNWHIIRVKTGAPLNQKIKKV